MADRGVLVVTGGSRGIGAATCRLAAKAGYAVVVNYAQAKAAADALVGEIEAGGGRAVAVQGDVGIPSQIEPIFAAADRLGTLTGLVNNAGILGSAQRVEAYSAERIAQMLAINVTGSILCAKAAILRMSTRHGGKGGGIVNVGSSASKLGGAGASVDYAASKGAIDSFTVGLAQELAGEGIRVNGIRPGLIDTDIQRMEGDPDRLQRLVPQVPMGRAGTAEEVARAIMWFLSEDSAYCTGSILSVSGGRALTP
jgi:NAD(P)-dependent dehydrogenase (short-subunit alcohol dehydrogenase family)